MAVGVSDHGIEHKPAQQRARIEGWFDRCVRDGLEALFEAGAAFLLVLSSGRQAQSLAHVLLVQTCDGAILAHHAIVAGDQEVLGLADCEALGGHGRKLAGTRQRAGSPLSMPSQAVEFAFR